MQLVEDPGLVLEYVDSSEFYKEAKSTDPQEITFYLVELLSALDSYHSHVIIHRDIKNRNIIIDKYDFSLNLWSLGCVSAMLVFKQSLFAADSEGRSQLVHFVEKYHPPLTHSFHDVDTAEEGVSLSKFETKENLALTSPHSLNLLRHFLQLIYVIDEGV
ncbi:unnamed protein product [Rodentolepis nana]|uniref:non-specific serine/threonine protein kinase n=1 Tax=Rodentolepis nana TaxID=102285 RepID=A0A0R3TWM2_RODNA|nr:unnamed protein product [Rodentolepis nana]